MTLVYATSTVNVMNRAPAVDSVSFYENLVESLSFYSLASFNLKSNIITHEVGKKNYLSRVLKFE